MNVIRATLLSLFLIVHSFALFSQNTPLYFPPLVGSTWTLYDVQGRQLRTSERNTEMMLRVDGTGLEPGVFWLKMVAGEQTMWRKLVKTEG